MSRYDSEWGTITLPAAAVAQVKEAVRKANNELHDQLYNLAADFWKRHRTTSTRKYREALHEALRNHELGLYGWTTDELSWLLEDVADHPRKLTHEDIDRAVERATNRTTSFHPEESSIRFEGRKLHYSSGENNHQVERARNHPVVQAMFAALNRVQWTRGSGGQLLGNDEYNRDNSYEGGGGNYVTETYPPPYKTYGSQRYGSTSRYAPKAVRF